MNPGQTAPKGAVWSGFVLFAIKATKVHKQMKMQVIIAVSGAKSLTNAGLISVFESSESTRFHFWLWNVAPYPSKFFSANK